MLSTLTFSKYFAGTAPRAFFYFLLFALLLSLPVAAQSPLSQIAKQGQYSQKTGADQTALPATVEELKAHLARVQTEIAALDSPERRATGAPPGTPEQELQLRIRMLRMLAFSYRQQLNTLENFASLQKIADEARAKRQVWSGPTEKPPYSMLLVDKMRAEQQANLLNLRGEEMRLKTIAAQIENTRERLAKASVNHRRSQEMLEAAQPAEVSGATWRRDLAALETQALGAFLESLLALTRTVEANILELGQAADFDRRKISEVEKSVVFKPEDHQRLLTDIEARRSKLIKQLDMSSREREALGQKLDQAIKANAAAEQHVVELEARLTAARKALDAAEAAWAKSEKSADLLDKVNPFHGRVEKSALEKQQREVAELQKQLASARAVAKRSAQDVRLSVERERNGVQAIEVLNTGLIALDMHKTFWDLRYAAHDDPNSVQRDRKKILVENRRLLKVLNPVMDLLRTKLEAVMKQIAEEQSHLRASTDNDGIAFQKALLELLAQREHDYLASLAEVEETRHLLSRWIEEEEIRSKNVSASEQVENLFGSTGDWLKTVWNFELFAVEDSMIVDGRTITGTRGVTVAKVVHAISIVVIGYLLIALLTRVVFQLALRRGKLEETSARIARKWILAVTLVILLLLALDAVKIPLAAFAFLGGAIAIGAGFGTQTLLKNLISGVMLLMERPFKSHDIVEVGGIRGEVTDLNVRSCTIRDVNGIETLVPNSTFLEQNVTNWTLSNRRVRYTLNIGVAYGSPARKVADLLLAVASRHHEVLRDPAPEVLFMDFGDNALMFALYVWLEVAPGRRGGNLILSDLRFMIDASFAEQGIEIPFPQRDVHLDASSPLPVRMVTP